MINGTEVTNNPTLSPIEIIIALGTIATAVILGITLYLQVQDRKPKFVYEKYRLDDGKNYRIRILHPDKKILRFSILIDNKPIPLSDSLDHDEVTLEEGTAQNFDVPTDVKDDSKVVIKYDKYKLKMKFRNVPFNKFSPK